MAGSPPPMRGKGSPCGAVRFCFRITPAYAGKSEKEKKQTRQSEDHPRLCGEKLYCLRIFIQPSGSPPPMRGKGFDADRVGVRPRITPAYAGKSNGYSLQYMHN